MNREKSLHLYEDDNRNADDSSWWSNIYIEPSGFSFSGFFLPHTVNILKPDINGKTYKNRYTCKNCKTKINDNRLVITNEPWRPTYHVLCYVELFNNVINQLTAFRQKHVINMIPEDEKEMLYRSNNDIDLVL